MHNSRMVDLRRVDCGGRALYRRVLRLILIASAGVLSLTLSAPASRPIQAECVSLGCRLYLPLVGGRHRLDMSEFGLAGPRWRHLGQTDRIRDMAYDQRGHLWTATEGGLVEWPPAPAVPIHHSLRAIRLVAVDASGAVWSRALAGGLGANVAALYNTLFRSTTDSYGPGWVTYRVPGRVSFWWLELSPALGRDTSLPIRYESRFSVNQAGVKYRQDFWSLQVLHRF